MYLVMSVEHLGLHPAVRRAVGSLSHAGEGGLRRVTSALLLANGPDLEPSVRASWGWRDGDGQEEVGLGLELNLSHGRPLSDAAAVPSLVDDEGLFASGSNWFGKRGIKIEELRREWTLQVERVKDLGVAPTHLSTLGMVHGLPRFMALVQDLAEEFHIPWVSRPMEPVSPFRFDAPAWRCRFCTLLALGHKRRAPRNGFAVAWPNRTWGHADQGTRLKAGPLAKAMVGLGPSGVIEAFSRPGLTQVDDQPLHPDFADSGLGRTWQSELDGLLSRHFGLLVAGQQVKLRHYGQLRPKSAV